MAKAPPPMPDMRTFRRGCAVVGIALMAVPTAILAGIVALAANIIA